MRTLACAILSASLLVPASAPAQRPPAPLEQAVARAKAEQAAAEAQTRSLEREAAAAKSEVARLRAQQAAAAQAIEAAEARITAADARLRLLSAEAFAQRAALAKAQRPVSALLAGIATMANRPPLVALVGGDTDELVQVSVLLDSTLPVIRQRTRALSARLTDTQMLEERASAARRELSRSRDALAARREQFASLEKRALDQSLRAGGRALGSGDAAIAAAEQVERLRTTEGQARSAQRLAALLASEVAAPPRPAAPVGRWSGPPFPYMLPVEAPVTQGLGEINASGVQSRGDRFATARGAAVIAPAAGVVRFSGPFRDYDGVLIIDHGKGWMTLMVNVSSPLQAGEAVSTGQSLGRALGPIDVQLSRDGRRFSPALIAGSSAGLSKGGKGG